MFRFAGRLLHGVIFYIFFFLLHNLNFTHIRLKTYRRFFYYTLGTAFDILTFYMVKVYRYFDSYYRVTCTQTLQNCTVYTQTFLRLR